MEVTSLAMKTVCGSRSPGDVGGGVQQAQPCLHRVLNRDTYIHTYILEMTH